MQKGKDILIMLCFLLLALFFNLDVVTAGEEKTVNFSDENLKKAVIKELDIEEGEKVTREKMKDLSSLEYELPQKAEIKDLTGLEHAVNLERLLLDGNSISDLSPLSDLKNLGVLSLKGNKIEDISPLSKLEKLGVLFLNENEIKDISPLSELEKLSYLHIHENKIKDISPLSELEDLRTLYLHRNNIKDISPLKGLESLTELTLHRNRIEDVSPLLELDLRKLMFFENEIEDISPLAEMEGVRTLLLHGNNISDVTPLSELENLRHLRLDSNQIENISSLSDLEELQTLNLRNNEINDITPLSNLDKLETLALHKNEISDITPLSGMENLEWLRIHENNIDLTEGSDDLQVIEEIKELEVRLRYEPQNGGEVNYPTEIRRLEGKDRYETAVEISRKKFKEEDSAGAVVLARGDNFPDALAGVPLAHRRDAPLLLTRSNSLVDVTRQELERLGAGKVYLLGGKAALSEEVENELSGMGLEVKRIGGEDRYQTAEKIAGKVASRGSSKAVVVSGRRFQDALVASPYAAAEGMPVLLSKPGEVPKPTRKALEKLGVQETVVVGHSGHIGEEVVDRLPDVERVGDPEHYSSAVETARYFDPSGEEFYIATGDDFADALAGGTMVASNEGRFLLAGDNLPSELKEHLNEEEAKKVTIFGGEEVITQCKKEALYFKSSVTKEHIKPDKPFEHYFELPENIIISMGGKKQEIEKNEEEYKEIVELLNEKLEYNSLGYTLTWIKSEDIKKMKEEDIYVELIYDQEEYFKTRQVMPLEGKLIEKLDKVSFSYYRVLLPLSGSKDSIIVFGDEDEYYINRPVGVFRYNESLVEYIKNEIYNKE